MQARHAAIIAAAMTRDAAAPVKENWNTSVFGPGLCELQIREARDR